MEIGNIVYLKSGSPLMTVQSVSGDKVKCQFWNPYSNSYEEKDFIISLLRLADPSTRVSLYNGK